MIHSKNISVILQGPIHKEITQKSISSIRRYFPHAECILSTWEGEDTNGIDVDSLLLNKKPPSYRLHSGKNAGYNNVNLQLVSTQKGLKEASATYSLKLRTDFILSGNSFLQYFSQFQNTDPKYTIFTSKILCPCYFSRNPKVSLLFHPSDITSFGYTKDLQNFYSAPLMEEKDVYYYEYSGNLYNKFVPEQYIFIHCLQNNGKLVSLQNSRERNALYIEETERYFASNFIFLDWKQYTLLIPKKFENIIASNFVSCITHIEWQHLYKKYIDNTLEIPTKDTEREFLKKIARKVAFLTFIARCTALPFFFSSHLRKKVRAQVLTFLQKYL